MSRVLDLTGWVASRPVLVWRYLDHDGSELGSSEPFDDRESAESWLSISWADLSSNGIEEVALFDQERSEIVYRMSLAQETVES